VHVGPFSLNIVDRPNKAYVGSDTAGEKTQGIARVCTVTGPEALTLDIAFIQWETGLADVRALELLSGPELYGYKGGRIGASLRDGMYLSRLRISKVSSDPSKNPSQVKISLDEADQALEISLTEVLIQAGAQGVGTFEELVGETNTTKSELGVLFPKENFQVPLAAYVALRVVPLHRRFGLI
jgi:hypothetical protein